MTYIESLREIGRRMDFLSGEKSALDFMKERLSVEADKAKSEGDIKLYHLLLGMKCAICEQTIKVLDEMQSLSGKM